MSGDDLMSRENVAAHYGIHPDSVTKAVRRGSIPPPDRRIGKSPTWYRSTILAHRRPDEIRRLPVGTILRDVETGNLHEVTAGVAEGGGYYLIRAVNPPDDMPAYLRESRLQPGHIGGMFVVETP